MPVWQYCARLAIIGPSGSGKSWKSRLVGKLAYKGDILVEPTKPAFIDLCADNHTVILTEADEVFRSPGRSRGIVAVINASYEPDRTSSRKQGGVAVRIPLFCHAVLDGIDHVLLSPNRPDLAAMMSRCVILFSRKAREGYRPPRFDRRRGRWPTCCHSASRHGWPRRSRTAWSVTCRPSRSTSATGRSRCGSRCSRWPCARTRAILRARGRRQPGMRARNWKLAGGELSPMRTHKASLDKQMAEWGSSCNYSTEED